MAILEIFVRQVFGDQTGPDLIIQKTTNQSFHQENICRKFSVADPFHFYTDPDPRNRFHDYGSGSKVTFDSVNLVFPTKYFARLFLLFQNVTNKKITFRSNPQNIECI